jgi:hypothetical protein
VKTIFMAPAGVGCYRTRKTESGTCPRCGSLLVFRDITEKWYCPRRTRDPLWRIRRSAAGRVRFEPEAWEWLGDKLGLAHDDPRLESIAVDLARAKKLMVLVSKRGRVFAIAKAPTESRQE